MKFRADLNAMRAYAVACVVLFHFKLAGLAGGFLGVDVFFVISGYLMTSLILKSLASGTFSFWSFMWARTTRIVPGLLALIAVVMLAGAALAPPAAFASLGLHALSSALFYSNFVFAKSVGYFQGPADFLWLLHTWSLSLEWQFYCLLPIGLALLHRLRASPFTLLCTLSAACLLSLGLCVYGHERFPGASFYLLPFRAWELLAGATIASWQHAYPSARPHKHLATVGWLTLMASPFVLGNLAWPSAWTTIPVGAAAMIIAARHEDTRLLRHGWVQKLGLWSYSVYLFHWPLQVLLSYLDLASSMPVRCSAVGLSILLGYLGYRFIETPSRAWLNGGSRPLSAALYRLAPASGIVLLAAALIMATEGLPKRYGNEVAALEASEYNYNPRNECLTHAKHPLAIHKCIYGTHMDVGLYVWGDSHGDALMPAVSQSVDTNVEFSGHAGCAPLIGTNIKGERCAEFAKLAYERISAAPKTVPVLIIARFTDYVDPLDAPGFNAVQYVTDQWTRKPQQQKQQFLAAIHTTLCSLAKQRPVYVMRPLPEMDAPVPMRAAITEILHGQVGDETITLPTDRAAQRHQAINTALDDAAAQCRGVTVLNPYPYLCDHGTCKASAKGELLYIDRDHMSLAGNQRLEPMFRAGLGRVEALAMSNTN